jgi:hypothetical protein
MKKYWLKVKNIFKVHAVAIILSIAAGVLLGAPSFLAMRDLGVEYKGVPFLYQDNEVFYASRVREVMDGHIFINSPMLYEYKDKPTTIIPFGEYLYALISVLTSVDIIKVILLSKFLFPSILFFVIYYFVWSLLNGKGKYPRMFAIASASTSVLGFDLISSSGLHYYLNAGVDATYLSIWTRLVNPITGGLYLFIFLNLFRKTFDNDKYYWFPAGIVLGLMSGYYFSFALGFFVMFFWMIVFVKEKRFSDLRKTIYILLVGAVINIHTFDYFFFLKGGQEDIISPFRSGLLSTNQYLLNKVLILSAVLFVLAILFFKWRREDLSAKKNLILWVYSFIFSSVVAMNTQIILGFAIWPQHFVQFTNIFSAIIVFSTIFLFSNTKVERLTQIVAIVAIIVSFSFAIKTIPSYKHSLPQFTGEQRYAGVLEYLSKYGGRDCAVLVDEPKDKLAPFISIKTPCDTYMTTYVSVALPIERVKHNYFVLLKLKGIDEKSVDKYLIENEGDIYHEYFFRDWKDMFYHSSNPWLVSISNRAEIKEWIDKTTNEVSLSYKEFLKKDFSKEVKKYKVDYLVYDEKNGNKDPSKLIKGLKEVYSDSGIKIYSFE